MPLGFIVELPVGSRFLSDQSHRKLTRHRWVHGPKRRKKIIQAVLEPSSGKRLVKLHTSDR
jgi:hypothetical protein